MMLLEKKKLLMLEPTDEVSFKLLLNVRPVSNMPTKSLSTSPLHHLVMGHPSLTLKNSQSFKSQVLLCRVKGMENPSGS